MKNKEDVKFRTSIGGQALMEGILMRGPKKQAIVVNAPGGYVIKEEELKFVKDKYPILGWPIIRGVVNFISSMIIGVKALMFSASCLPEEQQEEPSKFEKWVNDHFTDEQTEKIIIGFSVVLGIALAIVLFTLLPTVLTGLLGKFIDSRLLKNLLEGVIRIIIFLVYLWFATKLNEIKRVWQYHGAEHKTIFCYEKGLELTVENCRGQSRLHPRCGTSFLFVVMIISILVFSVIRVSKPILRVCLKLLLLPVVVAVSYEINRLVGKHDNPFTRFLTRPGMWFQNFTTREPDDSMIEVGIRSLELVIPEKKDSDLW